MDNKNHRLEDRPDTAPLIRHRDFIRAQKVKQLEALAADLGYRLVKKQGERR